jgi:hypothetical protein
MDIIHFRSNYGSNNHKGRHKSAGDLSAIFRQCHHLRRTSAAERAPTMIGIHSSSLVWDFLTAAVHALFTSRPLHVLRGLSLSPFEHTNKILSIKSRIAIGIASAFAAYLASRYIIKKGREKNSCTREWAHFEWDITTIQQEDNFEPSGMDAESKS